MMKTNKKNRSSVLWTWTFSYIVVMFIPFISVFINYKINTTTIREKLINVNESILENVGSNVDYYVEMLTECYRFAFTEESFEKMQMCDTQDTFFRKQAKEHLTLIMDYTNCCSVDLHYMYYRDDLNFIITETSADYAGRYYKRLKHYNSDFMDYDEWKSFLGTKYADSLFVSENVLVDNEKPLVKNSEKYFLYYANTIANARYGNPNIIVGIPLEEIAKLTEGLDKHVYFSLKIGGETAAIFSQGEVDVTMENEIGEDCIYIDRTSNQKGISYSLIVMDEYFENELRSTQDAFVTNILVTLMFGVIGTLFMLRRNYLPVKKLVSETSASEVSGNEFLRILDSYNLMRNEKARIQGIVENQQKELLNSWILSLMKGRIPREQIEEVKTLLNFGTECNVAIIGLMIPFDEEGNSQEDDLLFFIVNNIFKDLMSGYKFFCIEDGRFQMYLFELNNISEKEWLDDVTEKTELLQKILWEKCECSVEGVITGFEEKIENVNFLYQKMMSAFGYYVLYGGSEIIQTQMLEKENPAERLVEYVKTEIIKGVQEGKLQRIQNAIESLFSEKNIPFTIMKMYVLDIFPVVMEMYRCYEIDQSKRVGCIHYVELLIESQDKSVLKENFFNLIKYMYDTVSCLEVQFSNGVVRRIKEYIAANYQDQTLSVGSIAEYMQRNPRYILKVFKEETGEGILDYINRYRITAAKEILSGGKNTIEEVMKMTGYVNISSFRRNFIKITGETPGKYMK